MKRNIAEYKVTKNARRCTTEREHSQTTAAWANQYKTTPDANVSIPSEWAVDEAKAWVDNGSKL